MLDTAVDDEVVVRNPCRIKGGGAENTDERPILQTGIVLDLADAIEPPYRALVLTAGQGGLRTGEMLGLTRADIDLLHGRITVVRQAQALSGFGRVVRAPKSDAGRRVVVIPAALTAVLEEHLATYAQPGANGVVFTGPDGGPLRRVTLSRAWTKAVTATDAPRGCGSMT